MFPFKTPKNCIRFKIKFYYSLDQEIKKYNKLMGPIRGLPVNLPQIVFYLPFKIFY